MYIVDVSQDRFRQAALKNLFEEDDSPKIWLPEDFEDELPDVRIQFASPERVALFAGVIAHDHVNPDAAVLTGLPTFARLELAIGAGREAGYYLKANQLEEYRLLEAGAWTARNAATVIPLVLTEEAVKHGIDGALGRTMQFEGAIAQLAVMTAQLEEVGVLTPIRE